MEKNKLELIVATVNDGFAGSVVYAAKEICDVDANIIKGRGPMQSVDGSSQSVFNEKEMVFILVDKAYKIKVMENITAHTGLDTNAQGMVFSLPVTDWSVNMQILYKENHESQKSKSKEGQKGVKQKEQDNESERLETIEG